MTLQLFGIVCIVYITDPDADSLFNNVSLKRYRIQLLTKRNRGDTMPAPEIIHQLVEKFTDNREAYRSGKYNEAQLRQEFLDKFFEALGWDIYNRNGYSPEYRDVVIEDSLAIEGVSKSPDYTIKIGKERKFYVEAKKPAVDIQYDIHPAYQLRRYAWNAHLPLSILTDFEEFSIYNCKNKPNSTDSAATGRDKYYRYTEYVEKWDEIASIFSRDAVWKGSFDRFAESSKGKKGTTEVDDAFLEDIENWRKLLAYNIALRNPQVKDESQMNYAVQMTIDRIIFLRICEDKGIEAEEQLKSISKNTGIYDHLVELFKRADVKYNSGLFHFSKEKGNEDPADTFTPGLKIDDKVLKEIINDIYYPCPYIFKEIPVEILGKVYEQFLGKVIRLTEGHQARIEEKPEVRKAGGVYYTPKYIVDYIVQNTVGKLLEGKTPNEVTVLKIVDPACGSGSFLLGAYQYLLDWHIKWYLENDPEKWAKGKNPAIVQASGGGWKLTTPKRKEILVNNIHGVDIDAQAVEVTKLSLLLKVLEEESGQLSLGLERVLPDLGKNIQCGNSLIGWDYFEGQLTIDEEERKRVNPFDWHRAFPQVFSQGGFDAVIGNPPYGAELSLTEREYVKRYGISTSDTAALMMTRAFDITKREGFNGFIVPKPFLFSSVWEKTREKLLGSIFNIGDVNRAWKEVLLEQLIYILQKGVLSSKYLSMKSDSFTFKEVATFDKKDCSFFGFILNDLELSEVAIARKAWNNSKPLNQFVNNSRGGMFQNKVTDKENDFVVLGGKHISRYCIKGHKGYCQKEIQKTYPNSKVESDSLLFQNIVAHIENPQPHIKIIGTLSTADYSTKSVILDTVNQLKNISSLSSKFILGLLLSRFINWYTYRFVYAKAIRTMHFDSTSTIKIPIYDLNRDDKKQEVLHYKITNLVDRMLDLHKRTTATPQEQERLTREIQSTDREIDKLVYELYGLTDEEIKIVEGG